MFKLHGFPTPEPGKVLGLIGANGIGKTTALKILGGKLLPNLGIIEGPSTWEQVFNHHHGTSLQYYLKKIVNNQLKAGYKLQNIHQIQTFEIKKYRVGGVIQIKDEREVYEQIIQDLDLKPILERNIANLSGGELQRFACAVLAVQQCDAYLFDEPTSFLDIKQRVKVANVIRSLATEEKYVIVVEHDLAILDYLSDIICCLYGEQGAYGVITRPYAVRQGINNFLDGYLPRENIRFREISLNFRTQESQEFYQEAKATPKNVYPNMIKQIENFRLEVIEGDFTDSEIIVMLGQNGTGKTTFINLLAGKISPDNQVTLPKLRISYKPQTIQTNYQGTVRDLLSQKIPLVYQNESFISQVEKPLKYKQIIDNKVKDCSGGELQGLGLIVALGKNADIYLIDEPSTYLDSEKRIVSAQVIKKYIVKNRKTAFIVEHDFIMATYLADRVIVFEGNPSISCQANSPQDLITGMNKFLQQLEITFRRDPTNFRPKINKPNSTKDREQKLVGNYFLMEP